MTTEQIELIVKLVALLGSVLALYKAFQEIVLSRKPRLREEFQFIKTYVNDLNEKTHPLLVEKGFLAISGDPTLSAAEIRYVLSLASPSTALRRHLKGRQHLVFSSDLAVDKQYFDFKPEMQSQKTRRSYKVFFAIIYAVTASLAFAPLLFARSIFANNWQVGIVLVLMFLVSFGWLAISALISFGKIRSAEELVLQQRFR